MTRRLASRLALTFGLVVALSLSVVRSAGLTTSIKVDMSGTHLTRTSGMATVTADIGRVWKTDLEDGVGADQADSVYTLLGQSIASGGTLSLDLKGSLVDVFGAAFTPAKLRAVYIYSRRQNTTNLTLFGDAASVPVLNTAATTATVRPGGVFLMVDRSSTGIAVTPTSADIIKIVNASGAAALVDLVFVGTSS